MSNGKYLGSESDNTEARFYSEINVLDMKLVIGQVFFFLW